QAFVRSAAPALIRSARLVCRRRYPIVGFSSVVMKQGPRNGFLPIVTARALTQRPGVRVISLRNRIIFIHSLRDCRLLGCVFGVKTDSRKCKSILTCPERITSQFARNCLTDLDLLFQVRLSFTISCPPGSRMFVQRRQYDPCYLG